MRVIVACEFSGTVRDAFLRTGHEAVSCDLLPSEAPGPHITGDIREVDLSGFDLMVAHPPCTDLAISGARWWPEKREAQAAALDLVRWLLDAPVPLIAVENPVGLISTAIRKPDQILQPYWFGEPISKRTCLWLKGLPPLFPTEVVAPEWVLREDGTEYRDSKNRRYSKWHYSTGGRCGHRRSIFFPGVARAMALQWGNIGKEG